MAANPVYRVSFLLLFVVFWMVRIFYVRKSRDPNAPRSRKERREAMKKGGVTGTLLIILMYVDLILILLYIWGPMWMSWADLVFPYWIHWSGAGLIVISIPIMSWVHQTLGKHYSYALETKTEQKLVTSGPYSRVRHPLYSSHNLFNLGMILLTANIPLIIFAIIGVPLTYTRIKDEERVMIQQFGSEYEEYMEITGRIFPKL
jgi:protein-S-isoprenylcysteine O-methyltransferase Ste14